MADPILTLAWLTAAHLVADFILQTGGIVAAKSASGGRAVRGLLAHGAGVAVALIPFALAFGLAGLWALLFITASHLLIDRVKVLATRRAEARALAAAHRRHEGRAPAAGLGRAWTPLPAANFMFDQLAHAAMLVLAWAIWLDGRPPTVEWTAAVDALLAGRDPAAVHEISLAIAVLLGLVIANARGGALLVGTLVRPLEAARELQGADGVPSAASSPGAHPAMDSAGTGKDDTPAGRRRVWSFRIGPLAGRVVAEPSPAEPAHPAGTVTETAAAAQTAAAGERVALPPPAKVGATIGVIERLLIVVFVLVGADAAIGFVVGAKTIARFKQLDDRDFAEYYLLGTLASVSIAIVTALVARAAFAA